MTQVSKYPISKEVENKIFILFIKTLITVKEENQAKLFIEDLFTPTERIMIAKRLGIALLLEKGYDYQTIRSILHVSAPTIASVSRIRQYGNNTYQQFIINAMKEEMLKHFLDEMLLTFVRMAAKSSKGGSAWRSLEKKLKKT